MVLALRSLLGSEERDDGEVERGHTTRLISQRRHSDNEEIVCVLATAQITAGYVFRFAQSS